MDAGRHLLPFAVLDEILHLGKGLDGVRQLGAVGQATLHVAHLALAVGVGCEALLRFLLRRSWVEVFELLFLVWGEEFADLNEVGVVELVASLAGVATQLAIVLLHEVLDDHLLHILGQLRYVNLGALEFHSHRLLSLVRVLKIISYELFYFGRWILQFCVVVLLDGLALIPHLAQVAWLRLQRHEHFPIQPLPLLRLDGASFLVSWCFRYRVLFLNLSMQLRSFPRKLEVGGDVPIFKSLLYLLLENDQFVLHLRVDVPLLIRRPKAPEGIANDVAEASLLLVAEDVLPQLGQDVLSLLQLLLDFLLLSGLLPLVLHGVRRLLHRIGNGRHDHF